MSDITVQVAQPIYLYASTTAPTTSFVFEFIQPGEVSGAIGNWRIRVDSGTLYFEKVEVSANNWVLKQEMT